MMYRRIVSLALALVIAAAFMPLTGIVARAEVCEPIVTLVSDDEGETEIGVEEFEEPREDGEGGLPEEIDVVLGDIAPDDELPEEAGAAAVANAAPHGGGNAVRLGIRALKGAAGGRSGGECSNATIVHEVYVTQNGSTVTVKGTISAPHYFYGLYVDATLVASVTGSTVDQTINMNAFETGYHTVWLAVVEGATSTTPVDAIGRKYVVSNTIADKPTYNGVFKVYHDYLVYYPYNMASQNTAGDLYMELSADNGKTWSRSGYMRSNLIQLLIQQNYKIGGLKAGTTYKTRIRYGKFVTYSTNYLGGDGKSYFFGGPVLNTTTIKTGVAKKPPIKSVTAKAVKVKYHKKRWPGYYSYVGGTLFWHDPYTERYYTCKVKVTVKLKKKPGTKGLWISLNDTQGQTKWVSGNKTTYTATFTPYPNYFAKKPQGHYKYTISVCSGQSKSWGGYSPTYSKAKKLS